MIKPRPALFKWRHFEPEIIVCAVSGDWARRSRGNRRWGSAVFSGRVCPTLDGFGATDSNRASGEPDGPATDRWVTFGKQKRATYRKALNLGFHRSSPNRDVTGSALVSSNRLMTRFLRSDHSNGPIDAARSRWRISERFELCADLWGVHCRKGGVIS